MEKFRNCLRKVVIGETLGTNETLDTNTITAKDIMSLQDSVFTLCMNGKEKEILLETFEVFDELRMLSIPKINSARESYNYVIQNRIIPNKDVNNIIADMAFGNVEVEEYQKFFKKAQTINRTMAYIHRFFIRDQRHEGAKIKFKNKEFYYNDVLSMLTKEIWESSPHTHTTTHTTPIHITPIHPSTHTIKK